MQNIGTKYLKEERKKLGSKGRRCIFLGFGDVTRGYKFYDHIKVFIILSLDVVFDETSLRY